LHLKIGISTLFALNRPLKKLPELLDRVLKEFDVDIVEYVDDGPHYIRDDECLSFIREMRSQLGIELSMHAPYAAVNIAATNPLSRSFSWKIVLESVEHARKLDCKFLVIHPGLKDAFTYIFAELREPILESIAFLARVKDMCMDYGITPLIENLSSHRAVLMSPSDFKKFFGAVNGFRMALDIPHAVIAGLLTNYIECLSDHIRYLHLSNNDGKRDMHWPLTKGVLDWKRILKSINDLLPNADIVVIENLSISDVKSSLLALKYFLMNDAI